MAFNYLFGPIPSRRLGISLGVDLVPHKVCNLNCIYCESGKTNKHINERQEYISEAGIISELNSYLSENPKLDYITFSGAGEPTLNSAIGNILSFLKSNYLSYKTALITNSLLLENEIVRKELSRVDLILPSLDAASQVVFQKINRPVTGIQISNVINGLVKFNKNFAGKMWLEYFVLPGVNDMPAELKLLKEAISKIKPDKLQINTLDRPGTQSDLKPASYESLLEIQKYFLPIKAEIISRSAEKKHLDNLKQDFQSSIIKAVARRPCSISDLSQILSLSNDEAEKIINRLIDLGKIREEIQGDLIFYCLPKS